MTKALGGQQTVNETCYKTIWPPIVGHSLYSHPLFSSWTTHSQQLFCVNTQAFLRFFWVQKSPPLFNIMVLSLSPLSLILFTAKLLYKGYSILFPLSHLHSHFSMFSRLVPPSFLKWPLPRSTMTILLLNPIHKYLSISIYQSFHSIWLITPHPSS